MQPSNFNKNPTSNDSEHYDNSYTDEHRHHHRDRSVTDEDQRHYHHSSHRSESVTEDDSRERSVSSHYQLNREVRPNEDYLCKVFIGNIPRGATDDQLAEFFSNYGVTFKDMIIMRDNANPTLNRGFGFFTLSSEEETDRLLFLPLEQFQGRNLDVKRSAPKDCDDPLVQTKTDRIFLGGLPQLYTIEEITKLFDSKYGNLGKVVEVIPKKDKITGKSRGFCFVIFENHHVVDKIMIENRFPFLNNKRLEVRKASSDFPIQGAPGSSESATGYRRAGKSQRAYDRSPYYMDGGAAYPSHYTPRQGGGRGAYQPYRRGGGALPYYPQDRYYPEGRYHPRHSSPTRLYDSRSSYTQTNRPLPPAYAGGINAHPNFPPPPPPFGSLPPEIGGYAPSGISATPYGHFAGPTSSQALLPPEQQGSNVSPYAPLYNVSNYPSTGQNASYQQPQMQAAANFTSPSSANSSQVPGATNSQNINRPSPY